MSIKLLKRRAGIRKSNPQPGDVYVSSLLTSVSVAYIQDEKNFVAHRVFPLINVDQQTGKYPVYNKGDFLRDQARPRAPSTESAGGGFNLTYPTYGCTVEAFHKDIDEQTRANYANMFDADRDGTEFVTQILMIRKERRWVASFFGAGIWGTDITGVTGTPTAGQFKQWDLAGSTPKADVDAAKGVMVAAGAPKPNKLTIDYLTFLALRNNADVKAQFVYSTPESIDEKMLAGYFGVDEVLVMAAAYTSALEGSAATTTGLIAGKGALLCYSAPRPSLLLPSAGYSFGWTGYTGAGENGIRISKIPAPLIKSDRIEGEMAFDQKMVAADCGVFFNGTIA